MSSTTPDALDLFAGEQVITCRDDATGLRAVIAIDDTTLGPGFGGVRWRPYPSQAAAVAEAQRLAAAMTLKHALADLPYGGAKSVVIADGPLPLDGSPERVRLMEAYSRFIARTGGTYIPGVDMGTTMSDMQTIRDAGARAFCDEVDPGPYTAAGAYAAMRAGVRHRLGSGMDGVRVLVQGAGHVGAALAALAAADGAQVMVSDIDPPRAAAVAESVGGTTVAPDEVIAADCDVFAPCAVARVITSDNVADLKASVVAGAANDTLDTPEVAQQLAAAGVTFVPDFMANAGGVIQVHAGQVGWSEEELRDRLERIGDRVEQVLVSASEREVTPVRAALDLAAAHIESHRR